MRTFISIIIILFGFLFLNGTSKRIPVENIRQIVVEQDTVKKKLTDFQRKEMEYKEWQNRYKKIDFNIQKMEKQSRMIDSLLGKKDTTKTKK
jgi:hypothetical protein